MENLLIAAPATEGTLSKVLQLVLERFDCVTGTIHRFEVTDGLLHLQAQRGIPPVIMDKVLRIPVGKGMAGLAAERRAPVQVCNLQSDASGVAKPGAKETQMEGCIAVPILREDGELRGAFGVAKPTPYEFSEAEQKLLLDVGARLARVI